MLNLTYVYYMKPLFRATGLALLTIFLISTIYSLFPVQALGQPVRAIQVLIEFLERTNLLQVALLLLLLSLADHTSLISRKRDLKRISRKDLIIARFKWLVGIGAVLYFSIIPLILLQSQTVNTMGQRILSERNQSFILQLNKLKEEINAPGVSSDSLLQLKQKYPWINSPEIQSIGDLRQRVDQGLQQAETFYFQQRAEGSMQITGINVRTCMLALIHGLLLVYFWHFWPSASEINRQSDTNISHLGVQQHDLHETDLLN